MDVRPYDPADREPLYALFARAGEGSPTGSLWGDSKSEADIYLTPYIHHDPESVLLAWAQGTPEARGSGAGAALMEVWFDRLRDRQVPGCHLQTIVENRGAVRFFERSGFRTHGPTPVVPGLRWRGRRVHQQTMVQEF